jgi:hypothetical protein
MDRFALTYTVTPGRGDPVESVTRPLIFFSGRKVTPGTAERTTERAPEAGPGGAATARKPARRPARQKHSSNPWLLGKDLIIIAVIW